MTPRLPRPCPARPCRLPTLAVVLAFVAEGCGGGSAAIDPGIQAGDTAPADAGPVDLAVGAEGGGSLDSRGDAGTPHDAGTDVAELEVAELEVTASLDTVQDEAGDAEADSPVDAPEAGAEPDSRAAPDTVADTTDAATPAADTAPDAPPADLALDAPAADLAADLLATDGAGTFSPLPPGAPKLAFVNMVWGKTAVIDLLTMKQLALIGTTHELNHGSIVMPGQKEVWLGHDETESMDLWRMQGNDPGKWKYVKSVLLHDTIPRLQYSDDRSIASITGGTNVLLFRPGGNPQVQVAVKGSKHDHYAAGISPDGSKLYTAHDFKHVVARLDTATLKQEQTWQVPTKNAQFWWGPIELKVSPDDKSLITIDVWDRKVSFLDPHSSAAPVPVDVPGIPHSVDWTLDSTRVLVQVFDKLPAEGDEYANVKIKTWIRIIDRKTHKKVYEFSWKYSLSHAFQIPASAGPETLLVTGSFGTVLRGTMQGVWNGQVVITAAGKTYPMPAMTCNF